MKQFIAEILGTALLILFGNGVVSNVVLNRTKGNGAGWIVIAFGWGMAVYVAAFCVADYSGAHLNPALSIALAAAHHGGFTWAKVPAFIAGQTIGSIIGAVIVYFFYIKHFDITDDPNAKLACFCTAPNIRSTAASFFCEVVGTFALVLPLLLMGSSYIVDASGKRISQGLGAIGALPVGYLVLAIGLSLGGTTGYAINPARDLGPRIAHAFLPIPGKRDSDWGYAWIPVVAPIVGALLAVLVAKALGTPDVTGGP
jgi:glycerol uptake facilitator protein